MTDTAADPQIRLTRMVACAGCAAKLSPAALSTAVQGLFADVPADPNVLVGFGMLDDAGVYKISDGLALVQTTDFFPPVVDDPYLFGEIAAANALSDVYAMGGTPLSALNIVCFSASLPTAILSEILRGGLAKCREANVALLGGHTVDDPEIKFGMAVTGTVHPDRVWSNAGAQVGDALILTKPIGVGTVTTAAKQGIAPPEVLDAAIRSMRTLNRSAREAGAAFAVHACTDVTGFSLLGHLTQMLRASGMTARLDSARVPLIPGALALARAGVGPGGTGRNRAHFGGAVTLRGDLDPALTDLLFDPQTSGGLLFAVAGENRQALLSALTDAGLAPAAVGEVVGPSEGLVLVD